MDAARIGEVLGFVLGRILHIRERNHAKRWRQRIAGALGRNATRRGVGVKRHAAPARDANDGLAGIVFQYAPAERGAIGVEHIDFGIAGETQDEFVTVMIEGESDPARRVGARVDIADTFLAEA